MVAPITAGTSVSAPALGGSSALGWAGLGLEAVGGIAGAISSGRQAHKQRQFERKMYRHRYQWAVEDVKAAGLNPAMLYGGGAGSVPSVSAQQRENPVRGIANSALQLMLAKREMQNVDADTELKLATAISQRESARGSAALADTYEQQAEFSGQTAAANLSNLIKQGEYIGSQIKNLEADSRLKGQTLEFNKELQPLLVRAQSLANAIQQYNLPEAAASAKLWEELGGSGKLVEMVLDKVPGLGSAYRAWKGYKK